MLRKPPFPPCGPIPAIERALPAELARPLRSGEALRRLRSLIGSGRYRPGTQLPPERSLAVQLGVGRPALREAIKALGMLGLLESRRGAGTFVKQLPGMQEARRNAGLNPKALSLLDVLELRRIVEPRAAWLAAARAGEADLRNIETIRGTLGAAALVTPEMDYALHFAILRASGNDALPWLYEQLRPSLLRVPSGRTALERARMRREHEAIVAAILRHQPAEAEKAMLEHLRRVGIDQIKEPGNRR